MGYKHFRSPLLTLSLLIFFPPVTKMFQFTGYYFYLFWISPLGYLGFLISPPSFSFFLRPFLLHPSHPSVTSIYFSHGSGLRPDPFLFAWGENRTRNVGLEDQNFTIKIRTLIFYPPPSMFLLGNALMEKHPKVYLGVKENLAWLCFSPVMPRRLGRLRTSPPHREMGTTNIGI